MQNNSYLKVKNYFKNLVENHNGIKAFSGFFNRDLQNKMSDYDGIESPYLALFKYELGLEGPKQNTVAVRKLAFAVMFTKVDAEDYEKQYQAIDDAERIALSVLARVQFDNNKREHLLYNTFIKNSVRILPVELSNESFGVEIYFNLKNPQSLKLNPADWVDVDKIC
ncbi:hypothetical protein [Tenacibaculum maritimum]|uniref:hypothetical protein n=1 Tax=Tenacibaculum maritimum TaxID=107401 RepID=UPI0012E65D27|nr:hypothetical protein [Tenacibaculum maritimum]CAA0156616.1 conserved hypothetical protein [Tenacibaculum maritimum]CAA0169895.1 conserved hypothetical protein [Tenacibaculum maritimum]CAA0238700.1 conserved hypothetical protein [Tenacibaculum maritimum]